jgi:hypothetical protein
MIRAWLWFLIDFGWFLATAAISALAAAALIATPIWLGMIHAELKGLRAELPAGACHCRHRDEDGRGPILPRVLPRVRRLGEEVGE